LFILVGRLVDIEKAADFLDEKPEKIERIIKLYCESGDVETVKVFLCPVDHEPIETKDTSGQFFCDLCQSSYIPFNCKKDIWYRPLHSAPRTTINPSGTLPTTIPTEFQEKFDAAFLKDPFQHTSLLSYFSQSLKDKPLNGKRILSLLHFLRDLVPFVEAMKRLGMDVKTSHFYFKDYPYPQGDTIKRWLEEQGCIVRSFRDLDTDLGALERRSTEHIGDILIVEDGGHIYPHILQKYPKLLAQVRGCVEQTTRGSRNITTVLKETARGEKIPVLSVADSELKRTFEPPHVAAAVVQNIKNFLPDVNFRGKKAGLLGYGSIGEKIAERLRFESMKVTIYDADQEKLLKASQEGYEIARTSRELVRNSSLIIGSSGNLTIGRNEILELQHGAYLVSASSEQYEFCIGELINLSGGREEKLIINGRIVGTKYVIRRYDNPEIFLLADGYPINFWGMESMPNQASDLVLTLLLLPLVELSQGNLKHGGLDAESVNEIAKKYQLAELYRKFCG